MSERGPALAAVSRAPRERMAPERGFERRGDSLALFSRCPKTADCQEVYCQTQRSLRRKHVVPIARPWATARAARRHQRRRGGARGAAEAQSKVPWSPGATQRRQFRSPTTHSAPWIHSGTSMRRYGSPIARRRARSRAAEHPKMAARAAPGARAGVAEAKKASLIPDATQGRNVRFPIAPSTPWGRPGA